MFKISKYYDIIYSWKGYKQEIEFIFSLLEKNSKPFEEIKILYVGCGTGEHLKYLCTKNTVDAFDINPTMVKIAKSKISDANIYIDDMLSFNPKTEYDLVLCLFSTISYSASNTNFDKVLLNVYHSLKKGGVFIFEPHFTNRKFYASINYKRIVHDKNVTIMRRYVSRLFKDKAEIIFNYEINDNYKSTRYNEIHKMVFLDKEAINKKLKKIFTITKIYEGFKIGKEIFLTIK